MKVSWRRVFFFCFSWAITCMDTLHLTRSFVWHFDQQYCRSLSVVWYPWLAARAMLREAQSSAAPRCNDLYRVLTDRRVSLTHCCNAEDFPASVQGTHLAFMIAASWCWVLHSRASVYPLALQLGRGRNRRKTWGFYLDLEAGQVMSNWDLRRACQIWDPGSPRGFFRPITWAQLLWAGGLDYAVEAR